MKHIKRCVLHFGLHKTGSTSIQQFLRRQLNDPAFFYPESGRDPHLQDNCQNRILVAAFRASPEQYHAHAKEGASRVLLRERGQLFKTQLQTWAKEEGTRTLILSAEELSNFEFDEVQTMAQFLRHLTSEISGIGYVRKYKELQESRFQQAVRMPGPRRWLLPPEDKRFARFHYRDKIEKFLQIFGRNAVIVRKFDRNNLEQKCVVCDFCKTIGISQPSPLIAQENKSLSLDAIRLLYTHRKFCLTGLQREDSSLGDYLLAEKLAELAGFRAAFHSTLLTQSEEYWRADVDWISEFLGEEMLGNLFADDDKPCIRNEADLFCFSTDSLEWLAKETGLAPSKLNHATPETVGDAVGILRDKTMRYTNPQKGFMARAKGCLNRLF